MLKNKYIKIITASLLFGSLIFIASSFFLPHKSTEKKKYNVVFIAIDDLRPELNCYGAEHIISPNIDKLAKNGVLFKKAYVQQAICMASRASILSGLRPETNGIYTGNSVSKLIPNVLTLNKFFEKNGYNVAGTGKIYHHDEDNRNQFKTNYIVSKKSWRARGYFKDESIEKKKLNIKDNRGPAYEFASVNDTIYEDGINTLNAIRKLNEFKKDDKPFFLALGLRKPHLPFVAPKKYWDLYPKETIKLSNLKTRPENSNKYTLRVRGELNHYYNIPHLYKDISDSLAINLRRAYYACVTYADTQVGKLLKELKKLDLDKNTIIVLWGDHGYKLGDYNSWCKWSNMNIDTNIPFIFSHPDGFKGKTNNKVVEALNIYPTLADLCGLDIPEHIEGKSLRPLLMKTKETFIDDYAYTIWPEKRKKFNETVMGYSIKTDKYNYVEWVRLSTGKIVEKEFYNRENDPNETINVIEEKRYESIISKLEKQLEIRKQNTDLDFITKK